MPITPENAVAIKFCDVSGYWHEAISAPNIFSGFTYPNSSAGHWYHMAAVSDGRLLSLYLSGGAGYQLVAQTDLGLSGSPNTALTAGMGSGADWTAGNWSVGRGLYAGAHTDRAYGFIDEVRISNAALNPSQFLFAANPALDFDADGGTDIAVRRPGNSVYYVLPSASPGTFTETQWGVSSDIPVIADYDGDGKVDIAVWRPSSGTWYALPSASAGTYIEKRWGESTDVPISALTAILRQVP